MRDSVESKSVNLLLGSSHPSWEQVRQTGSAPFENLQVQTKITMYNATHVYVYYMNKMFTLVSRFT